MEKKLDYTPAFKNYKSDFENLIKLAITHVYASNGSLPTLDKDYPNKVYKWSKEIIYREDIIFNKDKPFICQTGEAKQDEGVPCLVIGNTMHIVHFMLGYFFTHKKGDLYTIMGEIGPYDDIIYAELLTRGYIEDYNVRCFYQSNQENTINLIKKFCSLDAKKKKVYIMVNEDDYQFIHPYLDAINENSNSSIVVYVQKDFEYKPSNKNMKVIDFNIEETLIKANYTISNGVEIITSNYNNACEYGELKENKEGHIYYYNPSWGSQFLINKYGDREVTSKATLLSNVSAWEKIFLENLLGE